MRRILLGGAAALALALPVAARAQTAEALVDTFRNTVRAYLILALRSAVEFTYESAEYDLVRGVVLTGVTLRPHPEWQGEEICEIHIGRAAISGELRPDRIGQTLEIGEFLLPPACIPPDAEQFLAQIGYGEGITVEATVVELTYDLPTAAARVAMQGSVAGAFDVNLTADFGYLWFSGLFEDRPEPVAHLRRVEASIENRGVWEKLEPMVAEAIGSVDALPAMLRASLAEEMSMGGRQITPDVEDFLDALETATSAFLRERSRLTLRIAPEGGVWLNAYVFGSAEALLTELRPVIGTATHSELSMVAPDLVAAAVAGAPDVGHLDKLEVGRALMSGIGAPRDLAAGVRLLAPLAEAWDSPAAMALAEGLAAAGDPAAAYPWVLRAMAGSEPGAIGLADRLEAELPARTVLEAQAAALAAWSADPGLAARKGAILASPDIAAIRRLANDARLGRGVPRSYEQAYLWASVAAAAGDRAAAILRDELDARARGAEGAAWRAMVEAATAAALRVWAEEGLGAALHARLSAR